MDPDYLIVRPVEFGGAPRPRLLLKDVYKTYTAEFRRWFAITAPTSLLASVIKLATTGAGPLTSPHSLPDLGFRFP
jgi:hypothetical protein